MATKSFYEMMVIDTPEFCVNPVKAFEDYGKYGPYVLGETSGIIDDSEIISGFIGM